MGKPLPDVRIHDDWPNRPLRGELYEHCPSKGESKGFVMVISEDHRLESERGHVWSRRDRIYLKSKLWGEWQVKGLRVIEGERVGELLVSLVTWREDYCKVAC